MKKMFFCLLPLVMGSCSMYKSEFDCPAGVGIGCKSVSEVIDLIVEREENIDLFVKDRADATMLKEREKTLKGKHS